MNSKLTFSLHKLEDLKEIDIQKQHNITYLNTTLSG